MYRLRNKKCSETGPNRRCSGLEQYHKWFRYYLVFIMSELSNKDKMHIQKLCKPRFGAKAIKASYPDKKWSYGAWTLWDDLQSGRWDGFSRDASSRRLCCCSWWTFWTLLEYSVGSWHSSLKCLNWRRKAVKNLIHYLSIFNVQLHVQCYWRALL